MHEYGQNNSLFIELLNNTKKVIQARVDSFNCPAGIGCIPYKIAPKVSLTKGKIGPCFFLICIKGYFAI